MYAAILFLNLQQYCRDESRIIWKANRHISMVPKRFEYEDCLLD
jgi:hypothetical protein